MAQEPGGVEPLGWEEGALCAGVPAAPIPDHTCYLAYLGGEQRGLPTVPTSQGVTAFGRGGGVAGVGQVPSGSARPGPPGERGASLSLLLAFIHQHLEKSPKVKCVLTEGPQVLG